MAMTLEILADSLESALIAQDHGADRIELCANMNFGGTTPSAGLIEAVVKNLSIPVFVMLRPRGGNFVYSEPEYEVMKHDLSFIKSSGASGVVFGILTKSGDVDKKRNLELCRESSHLGLTFHRAIDQCTSPMKALEDIIDCGFERILTSGGASAAIGGVPVIQELVHGAKERISIMAGAGVSSANVEEILRATGVSEVHASAKLRIREGEEKIASGYGKSDELYRVNGREVSRMSSLLKSFER